MSGVNPPVYVVMRQSGAIMTWGGLGGPQPQTGGGFFHILDVVAEEAKRDLPGWDRPYKLFLDGKLVIDGELVVRARAYVADRDEAAEYARREVLRMHQLPWMPSGEKTTSNPPGVDRWAVQKVASR